MDDVIIAATKNIDTYTIGGLEFRIEAWMTVVILLLIFLLLFTFARLRHIYTHWSLKGFIPSVLFGVILTVLFEGLFIVSGKTILTEVLKINNAPKPIGTALDEGREKLVKVLGEADDIQIYSEETKTNYESVVDDYTALAESDAEFAKVLICEP